MKTITLNIGLDTETDGTLNIHTACLILIKHVNILKSRVTSSPHGDEQVLIAVIEAVSDDRIEWLATLLNQACIATSDGKLIGPGAEKWGEFNPDFFVEFEETVEKNKYVVALGTAFDGLTFYGPFNGKAKAQSWINTCCNESATILPLGA